MVYCLQQKSPGDKGDFFLWHPRCTQHFPFRLTMWDQFGPANGSNNNSACLCSLAVGKWIVSTRQSEIWKITPRIPCLPLLISRLFRFPLWNTHGHEVEFWPTSKPSITQMERILPLCSALSHFWSESVQGRARYYTYSTQMLHLPSLGAQKLQGQTLAFSDSCVLSDTLVGRLTWALTWHRGLQAAPPGSGRGPRPLQPTIWAGEETVCERTVEDVGFPCRKPNSKREPRGPGPGAELLFLWLLYFPEY